MAPGGNKANVQNARAQLVESYNQILEEFTTGSDLKNVGNYSVSRMIGKGSFGKVYLARHKLTGTKVVLKSAEKSDLNLAREIHHYRQLMHPHIARLYEVIITETLVWLVLEYCAGDELYTYLNRNGRLSTDQTQRIFTQLCGAVAYIHMKNIVHRDLKLENILMDKHDNVKLCDFGFTRECEPKRLLQTFCGTICYAAPEMVKGEKYHGQAIDVWSLGIILYALICGELPFDDDDEIQTRKKISETEPEYPDYIPQDALALLKAILSKKSTARPSALEILQHPFLSPYAAQQIAILQLPDPVPFTTKIERDLIDRLRHAYVDTDAIRESVLTQSCDNLAGWWLLALEREQRDHKMFRKKRRSEKFKHIAEGSLSRKHSELASVVALQKPVGSEPNVVTVPNEKVEEIAFPNKDDPTELEWSRRKHRHGLTGALTAMKHMKHWVAASYLRNKQNSVNLFDSSSGRSSIKSLFSLHSSSVNGKKLATDDRTGQGSRNLTAVTLTVEKPAVDANIAKPDSSEAGANINRGTIKKDAKEPQKVTREVSEALARRLMELQLKDSASPPRRSFTPNFSSVSRSIYSTDSLRSNSQDRHSSPESSYVPRISRKSTSSSFSSLRSPSRRKLNMSRASSASSNSRSSLNRSPRSSMGYLPATSKHDQGEQSTRDYRQPGRKSRRHHSFDDNSSVSMSSNQTSISSSKPLTPMTSFFGGDTSSSLGRVTRNGRMKPLGFNGDAVFFRNGDELLKRGRIPFRSRPRGRKGGPSKTVADSGTRLSPVRQGQSERAKSAEGDVIEELDEPETVDEDEDQFSDDERIEFRLRSLVGV
ncbi:kinase-like domain-containing protein [Lipomyces arxii]|uniref:kinase-like domain-containing protein n=1 Tax=Lipomyces arxii TaxID=56418 RepID=UPI0034CFF4CC